MNKKPIMLAIMVFAVFMTQSVMAEVTEKPLLVEKFTATEPSLDTKWGKIWISNDYENYSHIEVVYSSTDAVNGMLRIKYGRAESNGAYTITFFNGTYDENYHMQPYHFNTDKKVIESVDVFRPENFSAVRVRFMIDFFEIRSGDDGVLKIYYKDTNGNIESINTNYKLPTYKWFSVKFIADKKNETVNLNILDGEGNRVYNKTMENVAVKDVSLGVYADVNDDNEGTYIYFDNFYRAEINTVKSSPPVSENNIKESGFLGLLIFFGFIFLLIISLYLKNIVSLFAVTVLSFLIFYIFVFPYSGFSGSINMLLSGIVSAVLSYIKYTTIKEKYDGIFSKIDTSLLLPLVGILILILLLVSEYGLG